MEVAFVCLQETNFELLGIIDDSMDKQGKKIFGFNIQNSNLISKLKPDIILITSIRYKDGILETLKKDNGLKAVSFYTL